MPPQEPAQDSIAELSDEQLERAFCCFVRFIQMLPKDGPISTPIDEQLQTYALFKQATLGSCDKPKPSLLHPIERLKWNAWSKLGDMPKQQAKRLYVTNFIKRTERDYDRYHKELPVWMADQRYADLKTFAKDHKEDFGITYLQTAQGPRELAAIGKEIGFEI